MCKATEQIMKFSICRSIHKFLSHLAPDYRAMDGNCSLKESSGRCKDDLGFDSLWPCRQCSLSAPDIRLVAWLQQTIWKWSLAHWY